MSERSVNPVRTAHDSAERRRGMVMSGQARWHPGKGAA